MDMLVNVVMWSASVFVVGGALFGWCFCILWWKSQHDDNHRGRGGSYAR